MYLISAIIRSTTDETKCHPFKLRGEMKGTLGLRVAGRRMSKCFLLIFGWTNYSGSYVQNLLLLFAMSVLLTYLLTSCLLTICDYHNLVLDLFVDW